ncbi:ABC transporter permease [Microaerobacter geothermalis]|uniref:ABC transporter permease n=1 Tax=Microaerobacter geothermalis TaxID=674972 RepID=UPI001F3D9777|nr:ABC transporter permease [Microaerobacter geothermalis]MCF6093261.1 ABC transporter permease [Microaerobacter geothermalis]
MEAIMKKYTIYLKTFKKYSYLLTILVKKDVKKKYKGSYLGILWSLLNPLLNMIVITIVFSTLFGRTIENFPVYLLSGLLLFGFFSSSTTTAMKSVILSANLIKKVYIPKYIFTLSNIISNFIFFAISLIDLVLIMVVTRADITMNVIYAPIYLILLFLFSCGVSLILATITVFFRDLEYLYGVLITALMYASAIFYPEEIIPEKYQFILTLNPVYYFISGFRNVVYYGLPLELNNLLISSAIAVISMIVGILVFEKNQDKFILYI